eukprot:scaffold116585_cov54-Phaeocystis_antarctica.AAC.1
MYLKCFIIDNFPILTENVIFGVAGRTLPSGASWLRVPRSYFPRLRIVCAESSDQGWGCRPNARRRRRPRQRPRHASATGRPSTRWRKSMCAPSPPSFPSTR